MIEDAKAVDKDAFTVNANALGVEERKQAVDQAKAPWSEAEKAVESVNQAINNTKANKKSAAVEIKEVSSKKRQLEDAEANIFRPLKEARIDGSESKQLRQLCKIGQKHGLHRELLTIAPAVLKKQLDKRQTFDNLAVKSLGAEFDKHAKALASKLEDCEQAFTEKEHRLHNQQNELQGAKSHCKESRKKLLSVEARLEKGREALTAARQSVRKSPKSLKRATDKLESAQARVGKFRTGPLSTYERVLPLPRIRVSGSGDKTEAEQ